MTVYKNKHQLFPLDYPELWEFYKKIQHNHWLADEIKYSLDKDDWASLSNDERHFIKMILAFFAQSDAIVNENIASRFMRDIPIAEAKQFYSEQIAQEAIHSESYNLMIKELIKDPKESLELFNAIENFPTVAEKAKWAIKWIESERPIEERLYAFAIVEGVFFSGSFCAIYWIKTHKKMMKALSDANDFISRDEALHWSFAARLYDTMVKDGYIKPIDQKIADDIMREAIEIESRFVRDVLPVSMIGMNAESMIKYIKSQADNVRSWFSMQPIFNERNPFEFMKMLEAPKKNNFFERTGTSYQKAEGHIDYNSNDF